MSKKDKSKGKKKFTGQVSITRARKILGVLGFKTASGWDEAQLTKKIRNLPVLADGALLEPKMQKQVNTICNAIKKGTPEVFVVDLSDEAADKKRAAEVVDAVARVAVKDEEKKTKRAKKEKNEVKKEAKEVKVKEQAKKAVEAGDKKKKTKKETKKKEPGTPSNKQVIYGKYKVSPEKATEQAEKWFKEIKGAVKLTTIKGWIGMWNHGKGLPKGA